MLLPTWAAREPKHQVRFWLEAGLLENAMGDGTSGLLGSNRYLRDVLTAKGYEVAYREFPGGHDHWSWRGIYLDGLRHLLHEEG